MIFLKQEFGEVEICLLSSYKKLGHTQWLHKLTNKYWNDSLKLTVSRNLFGA